MSVTAQPGTLTQIEVMRVLAMAGIFFITSGQACLRRGSTLLWPGDQPYPESGPRRGALVQHDHRLRADAAYAGPTGRPLPRYKTFLRQRFLRICPNYYLSLLFWTGVAVIVGGGSARLARSLAEHLLFVHTFDPAVFFDIVPAYWWMGLIAQFYLLYPCLWKLYQRWGAAPATVFLCLLCWGAGWFHGAGATSAWLAPGAGALSAVL